MKTLGLLLLGLASACSHEPSAPATDAQLAARDEVPADALLDAARVNEDTISLVGDWRLSPQGNRVELEVRAATDVDYRLSFWIRAEGKAEHRTCTARLADGVLQLDGPIPLGERSIAMLYPLRILGEDALVPDVFLSEYGAGHLRRGDSECAFKREFLDIRQPFSGPDDIGY